MVGDYVIISGLQFLPVLHCARHSWTGLFAMSNCSPRLSLTYSLRLEIKTSLKTHAATNTIPYCPKSTLGLHFLRSLRLLEEAPRDTLEQCSAVHQRTNPPKSEGNNRNYFSTLLRKSCKQCIYNASLIQLQPCRGVVVILSYVLTWLIEVVGSILGQFFFLEQN